MSSGLSLLLIIFYPMAFTVQVIVKLYQLDSPLLWHRYIERYNVEMMPGIVAIAVSFSITTWLLLKLMDSILLKVKQNSHERKLILAAFFVILICYLVRLAGSIVVHLLNDLVLTYYVHH